MSVQDPRRLPPQNGIFQELTTRGKLILRLMGDRRVNFLLKLIPFTSLVYFLFPDLMPGPIDDAVLIWLTSYLFVELCPSNVVKEHITSLSGLTDIPPAAHQPYDVIDGEYHDLDAEEDPSDKPA